MNEEESIFGTEPERLLRLMRSGLEGDEGETASASGLTEQAGQWIDRYRLLRRLGEGGMGIVYLAEQQGNIRRRVALKLIKPGMDSQRVLGRFEAERQALAMLDHPNIARVYDAGTTEAGRPYFVMEYVKGTPITGYCDQRKMNIRDRLVLFVQVCHAVHHAHQKGIIHRDIKPSNILVTTHEDKAVPKMIDFGVAKAIIQPLTERTLYTERGQLFGTPEYMSPEQADMASEDIDTRSDIYSLGILLYELLTGVLPFDSDALHEGGIEHIRQLICNADPKTPSTRLTKLGNEAKQVAENRRTEIGNLARCLRRELEWIPLKAMCKQRSDRYRSAAALADDIENYLEGGPLMAGPPTVGYRLRKFLRRHKALVGGIAAVLIVLAAGVVVSTKYAVGQARARAEAVLARAEAQQIAGFLEDDVLGAAGKARVGEATVGFLLTAASASLEGKFKDKPLVKASISLKLGHAWRAIGETDEAEQHFLRAIEIYKQQYGEEAPTTLNEMDYLGYIYEDQGRYRDMERLWTRILEIRQRIHSVEYPASTANGLAVALCYLGKYDEAESCFKKALELKEAWHEVGGTRINMFPYLKCNLARVYAAKGRYSEAEQLLRENLGTARADTLGMDARYGVNVRYSTELANLYREWGRHHKAKLLFGRTLAALREIKGNEHFLTIVCMYGLLQLYVDLNQSDEAHKLFEEALPIARRRLRKDHPVTLGFVNARGVLSTKQGQNDQAEAFFLEALEGRQSELGGDHPDTLESKNDLALLYKKQELYEEAARLLHEAAEGRTKKLGPKHPHTLDSIRSLIDLYDASSRPEKAEEWRAKLQKHHTEP